MDSFLKELYQGDLDLHDAWQVELETSIPLSNLGKTSSYIQEFYLLIPPSLQISASTYSREDFYRDRINFIREKTPDFPIQSLIEKSFLESYFFHPLSKKKEAKETLYLLANIFRSSLRKQIHCSFLHYTLHEKRGGEKEFLFNQISQTVACVHNFLQIWEKEIEVYGFEDKDRQYCMIARRYISVTIESYFSHFLLHIDQAKAPWFSKEAYNMIIELLREEKMYRMDHFSEPESLEALSEEQQEKILYERDSDKKSIRSVLFFLLQKRSFSERWNNVIASCAAGVAAFVYLGIIFWKSSFLAMNSMKFVILSSILYTLKDRIKDGVKTLFQRQAGRFFDDFRTDIFDNCKKQLLGKIHEYFMFIHAESIPSEIKDHYVTKKREEFFEERAQTALYYRKKVVFYATEKRRALHTVFRFHLRPFFDKISNSYEQVALFDQCASLPVQMALPKVYYLYFFIKTIQCIEGEGSDRSLYQKYLLVVDKTGIKRVVSLNE